MKKEEIISKIKEIANKDYKDLQESNDYTVKFLLGYKSAVNDIHITCNEILESIKEPEETDQESEEKNKIYKCSFCNRTFKSLECLFDHNMNIC